ncbi:MAG: zinc metallopeptidase [Fimbriimonadaceae bacterium]|nr:zinc metallopeptidase [Fimbriimonadaceae bacterium]
MRWQGREESDQIEDRRMSGGGKAATGGIGLIVVALIVMALGGNPMQVLQAGAGVPGGGGESKPLTEEDKAWKEYVGVTLKDTENVWGKIFSGSGESYRKPKLVMFRDATQSGCGYASSQVGPFYCGEDETVYIDTSFFQLMKDRFGAKGDFAPAYVIAHEVGHHVQKLLGTMGKVNERRSQVSERDANALSVRLELQADFYAGLWAKHAAQAAGIDQQDVEEALECANAIGDDTLQREAQGHVVPDSFTHGTSKQRMEWFMRGWKSGDLNQGNTFGASSL